MLLFAARYVAGDRTVGRVIVLAEYKTRKSSPPKRAKSGRKRAGSPRAKPTRPTPSQILITPRSDSRTSHHVSVSGRYARDLRMAIDALSRAITDLNLLGR